MQAGDEEIGASDASALSPDLEAKLLALKILTNQCRSAALQKESPGQKSISFTKALLLGALKQGGNFQQDASLSRADTSRMRLEIVLCILKLVRIPLCDELFFSTAADFELLALQLQVRLRCCLHVDL